MRRAALNADPSILFTRARRGVIRTTGHSEGRTGTSNRHRQHHKHSYRNHQDNALHYPLLHGPPIAACNDIGPYSGLHCYCPTAIGGALSSLG
jgi:hypothetical protein